MKKNEIVLFEAKDGKVTLPVQLDAETVWLTRMQMAELFGVTPQNITLHLGNIFKTGELDKASTSKDFLLVPQPPTPAQGWLQANRRPYACRLNGYDRRIKACREGDDGQSSNDLLVVTNSRKFLDRIYRIKKELENEGRFGSIA